MRRPAADLISGQLVWQFDVQFVADWRDAKRMQTTDRDRD